MKKSLQFLVSLLVLAIATTPAPMACGGMNQIPPPALVVGAPMLVQSMSSLPEYDCEVRITNLHSIGSPAGEDCGCGLRVPDGAVGEIRGAIVLAANSNDSFGSFGFFDPQTQTATQLNSTGATPAPAPQATGQSWLGAMGQTVGTVPDGVGIDMAILVSTTLSCADLEERLEVGNAVALGATDGSGLFDDANHFATAEDLAVSLAASIPALSPWGLVLLALVLALSVSVLLRRRAVHSAGLEP